MKKLFLATRNVHKVSELRLLLADLPVELRSLDELADPPAVVEDRPTFAGNAAKKAEALRDYTQALSLADDSGLEVDILGGYPGVQSARFAGEGVGDAHNNEKLLTLMKGVRPGKRGASFCCAIAIAAPGRETLLVEGRCHGYIGTEPRGEGGFGYDPLFIYEPLGKTFAEMSEEEKNRVSHRARALQKARPLLERLLKEL